MSDNDEITVGKDGFSIKGEPVQLVTRAVKPLANTTGSLLTLFDNIVGLPIDYLNIHLKSFRDSLHESIEEIPVSKRIEPSFRVGCSVLKNVAYVADEREIQVLFGKLLASAIDEDTYEKVHPSFSSILNEMTAIDARLLVEFCINGNMQLNDVSHDAIAQSKHNLLRLGILDFKPKKYSIQELNKLVGRYNYQQPRNNFVSSTEYTKLIRDFVGFKNIIVKNFQENHNNQDIVITPLGHNFFVTVFRCNNTIKSTR
ncbi:Abi-alpha family protein [Photobacterium satsumensis]|uniref:Abi-alpha family protein n=1 Tax=Photobacterium satsumensis TaxID=2910239 RepID=UPI003D0B5D96